MSEKHLVVCDACGKEGDVHHMNESFWYKVQTIVGKHEQLRDSLERVASGELKLTDVVDYGDFCSLECVANWASSRAEMRHLSQDVERGVSFDDPEPDGPILMMTPEEFVQGLQALADARAPLADDEFVADADITADEVGILPDEEEVSASEVSDDSAG